MAALGGYRAIHMVNASPCVTHPRLTYIDVHPCVCRNMATGEHPARHTLAFIGKELVRRSRCRPPQVCSPKTTSQRCACCSPAMVVFPAPFTLYARHLTGAKLFGTIWFASLAPAVTRAVIFAAAMGSNTTGNPMEFYLRFLD